ncbi:MAG: C39 family peptidase [Spirochaetaceae bacterium]
MKQRKLYQEFPYYSQWISSNLVGDIINGNIKAVDDPLWKSSGAITPDEYDFWAKNICGMACLKMILDYCKIKSPPLIELAKECTLYGGYKIQYDDVDGLFYVPFTKYLKERFELESLSVSPLSINEISTETLKGNIFIVSVHYLIRKPNILYSGKKGGHLVVITGVDTSEKCFYINNPSGNSVSSQKNFKVDFNLFEKYFAGRGILINPR